MNRLHYNFIICFGCLGFLTMEKSHAQSFKLMRFDEDYSTWKDSSKTFYHSLKYIPTGKQSYLSLGGEARAEFVYFDNEDWGRLGIGTNPFLLQRYDFYGDWHLNNRWRIFGQVRSAWESGRKNGARMIDEDKFNVQNLFIDYKFIDKNKRTLTGRVGRQELDYGSGRLISVREGPNLRLYFDGIKLAYFSPQLRVDAFVMAADTVNTGALDNKSSKQANLWGLYGNWIIPKSGNVEFYYIGIRRDNSVFVEGVANERRQTVGARYYKYGGGFIYNFEGAYQFGHFGKGKISAWTGAAEFGYNFDQVKGSPTISVRNDYISGDAHAGDGKLQTFNPIYPKGGYFGFNPQIGPVNLIDIHPYASYSPTAKLMLQGDIVFNWRYSLGDGIYRPSGTLNLNLVDSKKRYIGTAYLASATYAMTKKIALNMGVQYFKTGNYIDDVIPNHKNGLFINTRLTFKF